MMRAMADLPTCGIYRTTRALGDELPAGRLVFFHNHGDPGPGVYLPSSWAANRARWHGEGQTIPSAQWATSLVPLPAEGFYRVRETFTCCDKKCREYETDLLVQLGYDASAQPLLFVPEWTTAGLALPELGIALDADRLTRLVALKVAEPEDEEAPSVVH
jgi:hypothetical protein